MSCYAQQITERKEKKMNETVTLSIETYNALVLKAWKYDRIREKKMESSKYSGYYMAAEVDAFEATAEEIAEIKACKEKNKKEDTEDEAF
jgi:hypothetical protein